MSDKPQPVTQKQDTCYLTIGVKHTELTFQVPDVDAATDIIRVITNNSIEPVEPLPYGTDNEEIEAQTPFMRVGMGGNLTLKINKYEYPPHNHIKNKK